MGNQLRYEHRHTKSIDVFLYVEKDLGKYSVVEEKDIKKNKKKQKGRKTEK